MTDVGRRLAWDWPRYWEEAPDLEEGHEALKSNT